MSFVSYDTSLNMLELSPLKELGSEKVFLSDATGRTLAVDIVADCDSPANETASLDGYAIRHDDLVQERLKVSGNNPAGANALYNVKNGICIKTYTGSVMPEGSDTLLPIENVIVDEDEIVIKESVDKGFGVRPVGESYKKDEVLIKKGSTVGFAEIGVLAGLNRVMVDVVRKPRVAIISTGSELLDLGQAQERPSQIRSTNHLVLEALVKHYGGECIQYGVVHDDKQAIEQCFAAAAESADIVVSTGGVSVGDYDYVKYIVPRLGAEVLFHGVKIKPGQHVMVAQRNNSFFVALPGFAFSSTVTFLLYAVPLMKRFLGVKYQEPYVEAVLKEPFFKRSTKSEFTACNLTYDDGNYYVDFKGKKSGSSAILTNLLGEQSALLLSSEEDGDMDVGTKVFVMRF